MRRLFVAALSQLGKTPVVSAFSELNIHDIVDNKSKLAIFLSPLQLCYCIIMQCSHRCIDTDEPIM